MFPVPWRLFAVSLWLMYWVFSRQVVLLRNVVLFMLCTYWKTYLYLVQRWFANTFQVLIPVLANLHSPWLTGEMPMVCQDFLYFVRVRPGTPGLSVQQCPWVGRDWARENVFYIWHNEKIMEIDFCMKLDLFNLKSHWKFLTVNVLFWQNTVSHPTASLCSFMFVLWKFSDLVKAKAMYGNIDVYLANRLI